MKAARESLTAAQERHNAGVGTIADELQARTAFSQAELALQTVEGQIQMLRGSLATAMGVSANIPVEAGELPLDVNVDAVGETVDELIARAEAERPDLAAARLTAMSAESHVRSVRAQGLPSLFAAGTINRNYFYNSPTVPYADVYSGAILLRIPIFTGWKITYDTLKAREDAEVAHSQVETLTDQVILQVWTSYYALRTASQQVKTARDLFASAQQSEEVAARPLQGGCREHPGPPRRPDRVRQRPRRGSPGARELVSGDGPARARHRRAGASSRSRHACAAGNERKHGHSMSNIVESARVRLLLRAAVFSAAALTAAGCAKKDARARREGIGPRHRRDRRAAGCASGIARDRPCRARPRRWR